MNDKQTTEILFENGSVGYVMPGNDIALRDKNGAPIKQVASRTLSAQERAALGDDVLRPSRKKAIQKGSKWVTRDKTPQELVDEKIISPQQGEDMARTKHNK